MLFSENFACPEHGVSLAELEPRIFSFNSPHGACPRCTGLGAQLEIDPDLVVPDPTLVDRRGRARARGGMNSNFYESVIQGIADRYEVDLERPGRELPQEQRDLFLNGTGGERVYVQYRNRMGRKRSYMLAFEGIVKSLERRYRETDSGADPRADRGVHELPRLPGVRRRPAEAGDARGEGRRAQHPRAHAAVRGRGARRSSTRSS